MQASGFAKIRMNCRVCLETGEDDCCVLFEADMNDPNICGDCKHGKKDHECRVVKPVGVDIVPGGAAASASANASTGAKGAEQSSRKRKHNAPESARSPAAAAGAGIRSNNNMNGEFRTAQERSLGGEPGRAGTVPASSSSSSNSAPAAAAGGSHPIDRSEAVITLDGDRAMSWGRGGLRVGASRNFTQNQEMEHQLSFPHLYTKSRLPRKFRRVLLLEMGKKKIPASNNKAFADMLADGRAAAVSDDNDEQLTFPVGDAAGFRARLEQLLPALPRSGASTQSNQPMFEFVRAGGDGGKTSIVKEPEAGITTLKDTDFPTAERAASACNADSTKHCVLYLRALVPLRQVPPGVVAQPAPPPVEAPGAVSISPQEVALDVAPVMGNINPADINLADFDLFEEDPAYDFEHDFSAAASAITSGTLEDTRSTSVVDLTDADAGVETSVALGLPNGPSTGAASAARTGASTSTSTSSSIASSNAGIAEVPHGGSGGGRENTAEDQRVVDVSGLGGAEASAHTMSRAVSTSAASTAIPYFEPALLVDTTCQQTLGVAEGQPVLPQLLQHVAALSTEQLHRRTYLRVVSAVEGITYDAAIDAGGVTKAMVFAACRELFTAEVRPGVAAMDVSAGKCLPTANAAGLRREVYWRTMGRFLYWTLIHSVFPPVLHHAVLKFLLKVPLDAEDLRGYGGGDFMNRLLDTDPSNATAVAELEGALVEQCNVQPSTCAYGDTVQERVADMKLLLAENVLHTPRLAALVAMREGFMVQPLTEETVAGRLTFSYLITHFGGEITSAEQLLQCVEYDAFMSGNSAVQLIFQLAVMRLPEASIPALFSWVCGNTTYPPERNLRVAYEGNAQRLPEAHVCSNMLVIAMDRYLYHPDGNDGAADSLVSELLLAIENGGLNRT